MAQLGTAPSPSELHYQRTLQYSGSGERWQRRALITTETLTMFIDWNGDGRLDVLDARTDDSRYWHLWLNNEGPDGLPQWESQPRQIWVTDLVDHIAEQGLGADVYWETTHTAIERTRTWPKFYSYDCNLIATDAGTGQSWAEECWGDNNDDYYDVSQVDTVGEWLLEDINADGFPDIVANTNPVKHCEYNPPPTSYGSEYDPNPDDLVWYEMIDAVHFEYLSVDRCEFEDEEPVAGNRAVVVLNRAGVLINVTDQSYAPASLGAAGNGVSRWTTSDGSDGTYEASSESETSWRAAGYRDVSGIGRPVRVGSDRNYERFESDRHEKCSVGATGDGTFTSRQVAGIVDLNGDHLPDWVYLSSRGWQVRFGTMSGFGPERGISSGFALSESHGDCGGVAEAVAGLLDVDGDGKPEVVRITEGVLRARAIVSSDGNVGALDAGRLVEIGNGYGATTVVEYGNAKAEVETSHQVSGPEIIVASTRVVAPHSAPESVTTRYAYGTADSRYDPMTGRRELLGYRRTVALVGGATERTGPSFVEGYALVTDRVPPPLFPASHAELLLAGRPTDSYRLEGMFWWDPSLLLPIAMPSPQVRAAEKRRYKVAALPIGPWSTGDVGITECIDVHPNGTPQLGELLCNQAGIVYTETTSVWEGHESPDIGLRNVNTFTYVSDVDERGRPIAVTDFGDTRTYDDDRCITIQWATPTAQTPRALDAIAGIWVDDCGWTNAPFSLPTPQPGDPVMLAGERFVHDGLPEGNVGSGRVTSRIVETYDVMSGELLNEHVAETLVYGSLGEIQQVATERILGSAATRTTTLEHDKFGASVIKITEVASNVSGAPRVTTRDASTWPSIPHETVTPNGQRAVTVRDSFGRPVVERVHGDGVEHVVREVAYHDDAADRRQTITEYPATESLPQTTHIHLDALGRVRFRQRELGLDYGATTLISDLVEYDRWGHIVYQAAPFPWPTLPFMVEDLPADPAQWPFGSTFEYDGAGRPLRRIEAPGKRPSLLQSSTADDVFVTATVYTWQDGRAITRVSGPAENDPSSPTAGARDERVTTATGWPIEESRFDGTGARIDLVRRAFDRLGNEALVTRYRDPLGETNPVTWERWYDSSSQVLRVEEPGTAPLLHKYDEWGSLLETEWKDGVFRRVSRYRYDAYERPTLHETLSIKDGTTLEQLEQRDLYSYDVHSGSPDQPESDVRGRLSYVETVGVGRIYYAYDALGRTASETHRYDAHGKAMRTAWTMAPGGSLAELMFETYVGTAVATTDRISYTLDSAARPRLITDLTGNTVMFSASEVDAEGRYRKIALGNGVVESFDYAPDGREELLSWSAATASGLREHEYVTRDAEGRLLTERHHHDNYVFNVTNTYDTLDRLTRSGSLSSPGTYQPQDEIFTYDGLGNVLSKKNVYVSSQNRNYSYETSDRDRLCRFDPPGQTGTGCAFTYNAAGSVVQDTWSTTRTFGYDVTGRVKSISKGTWNATFLYGPDGSLARLHVRNGASTNRMIWSFGNLIEERTRPDGKVQLERRIPGPRGVVASIRSDATVRETVYVHGDGRGNRVFTRGDGTLTQQVRYRAYGDIAQDTGQAASMTYSDDLWNGGDDLRELGVVVLGARIYDPTIGRFLQRDPIAFSGSSSSGNPYAFAFDDPVNFGDPTGLSGDCLGKECDGPGADDLELGEIRYESRGASPESMMPRPVVAPGGARRQFTFCPFCTSIDQVGGSREMARTEGALDALTGMAKGVAEDAKCLLAKHWTKCAAENAVDTVEGAVDLADTILSGDGCDQLGGGDCDRAASALLFMGAMSMVGGPKVIKIPKLTRLPKSGLRVGSYRDLVATRRPNSRANGHHVVQDAAVRDLPGYNTYDAPAIEIDGPPQVKGTPHNIAGTVQRTSRVRGTFAAERRLAYKALRKAGVSADEARWVIEKVVDEYFSSIGVTLETRTRIPGKR